MENTKRDLSLDFTKPRHVRGIQPLPSLATPTPILALSTPELNKWLPGEELAVLTPNGISSVISQPNVLPSPLIPTTVNSNNIINNNCNNANNNNNTSNNASNNNTINHKRTDKTRDHDIEKMEKKRERNRLAAKKCRQRKLETIDELRKQVSEWQHKYERLDMEFERFKTLRCKEIERLNMEISELKSLIRQ